MLTSLRLGNFKAFGPTQRLPIKPITLIFGPNSAGKSSLIHGLALVHEAHRGGSLDAFLTSLGGASIDLGGFRQYVHRRDRFARVEVGLDIDVTKEGGRLAARFQGAHTISCTSQAGLEQREVARAVRFTQERVDQPATVEVPTGEYVAVGEPRVVSATIAIDGVPAMWFSPAGEGAFKLDRLDDRHPLLAQALEAVVLAATTKTAVSAQEMEIVREISAEIIPTLRFTAAGLFPGALAHRPGAGAAEHAHASELGMLPAGNATLREDLRAALAVFLPRVLGDYLGSLAGAIHGHLEHLSYLGPLRSYPPRHPGFTRETDVNWVAGGGAAWTRVLKDSALRERINDWLSSPARLQTPYRLAVKSYVDQGLMEAHLIIKLDEVLQEGVGTILDLAGDDEPAMGIALDHFGDGTRDASPEDLDPSTIIAQAMTDRYLESIPWDRMEGPSDLVLVDVSKGNVTVGHRDVGIGVSQVLPVLAAAFGSTNQVIAIEQPEIHLHPALQAELGDVFIESALGERRNTFILETHSEHLILRVLRRIRESARKRKVADQSVPAITPDDVAVLYVQPTPQGSVVHEIPLTKRGEFAAPWPDGFFPDRAKELF